MVGGQLRYNPPSYAQPSRQRKLTEDRPTAHERWGKGLRAGTSHALTASGHRRPLATLEPCINTMVAGYRDPETSSQQGCTKFFYCTYVAMVLIRLLESLHPLNYNGYGNMVP